MYKPTPKHFVCLFILNSILLCSCQQAPVETMPESQTTADTVSEISPEETEPIVAPEQSAPEIIEPEQAASEQAAPSANDLASRHMTENRYGFPADFVYPLTDGSTSTTNLDIAVRRAVLGGERTTAHTKTYRSLVRLADGAVELIFSTPLSQEQQEMLANKDFAYTAEPVAGEGFVFVVNKDNPVTSLTVDQLRGIYSGQITNWREVGGEDAPIVAYQRNNDSGSQNYMRSFMGDTPLMEPLTDVTPSSMSGILDVIANYDNGRYAIGYSVYAYSDGMYEDQAGFHYVQIDGVEPSLETLIDGTYPLLGYNYAIFSASEPTDSPVRTLVQWMQSDAGQQVILDAGYIPYRAVDGLTLPDPTIALLYQATGTGEPQPDTAADYDYIVRGEPTLTDATLCAAVDAFVAEATTEMERIPEAEICAFLDGRADYGYSYRLVTEKTLTNGYLSVVVGWRYEFAVQDSPVCYYDARTAVFDIYTGEKLSFSDLFFEGADFVPALNQSIADFALTPYSTFGATYELLRPFHGLRAGTFAYTADSILFTPGDVFADGVVCPLTSLRDVMVTGVPRDMTGYVDPAQPVYMTIRTGKTGRVALEKDGVSIWYLDPLKADAAPEACEKVNAYIDDTFARYLTTEKLLENAKSRGIVAEDVFIGPFPDIRVEVMGQRYICVSGPNLALATGADGTNTEFYVLQEELEVYYFRAYFHPETGEPLTLSDLFSDGWEKEAVYTGIDATEDEPVFAPWTDLAQPDCTILQISHYQSAPYSEGTLADLDTPVTILVQLSDGTYRKLQVPREYILQTTKQQAH